MQKLIFITGEAWTGKSILTNLLYQRFNNSAWLDGDDVWRVNPFNVNDSRLRNSDLNMAFVLENYLKSQFDYVFLTSIILCEQKLIEKIISLINYDKFEIINIRLISSIDVLKKRAKKRDNVANPHFRFIDKPIYRDEIVIDTSSDDIEQNLIKLIDEIKKN